MKSASNNDPRFRGMANLLGDKAWQSMQKAHIGVAGVGGVGSWVVESLVRSGVAEITLIDMDEVCVSNTNRQIHALQSTVGQSKVEVLKKRCLDINPDLLVHDVFDFVTPTNSSELVGDSINVFVDATDSVEAKCALAVTCKTKDIPLVMIGAAGGKSDPARVRVADLNKVVNDPLLRNVKRLLKRDHGFSTSLKSLKIKCVFSDELVHYPDGEGGVCPAKTQDGVVKLDCGDGLGAASFVTGTFGFFAAHTALQELLQ